jgi:hypothetical protein
VFTGRRAVIAAGVVLIALGIGALIGSYALAHGAHALAEGWWEGTLQALGVGFVVGGLVDVLAIYGLNRIVSADDLRRKQLNDRARAIFQAAYKNEESRNAAIDAFISENLGHTAELDPDIDRNFDVFDSLVRIAKKAHPGIPGGADEPPPAHKVSSR